MTTHTVQDPAVLPRPSAPCVSQVQELVAAAGVEAWVGGWTSIDFFAGGVQDSAGAYVMPYGLSGRDARTRVMDVLIGAGFRCAEPVESGTVQVWFEKEDW